MIRIKDYEINNVYYEVYLTRDVERKALETGLHEGIFLGATARIVSRNNKKYVTYYYAEQNVLFDVEVEYPNKVFFLDMKRLNMFEGSRINMMRDSINAISKPGFFRYYEETGKEVFLNGELPLKLKKMGVPPHIISLKNINVPEGNYSMYYNGVVIDFVSKKEGRIYNKMSDEKYYITNVTKPDFVNFGLALLKN